MKNLAPICKAAMIIVLIFGGSLALAKPLGFAEFYRSVATGLVGKFGSNRVVKFEPFDDPRKVYDTQMHIGVDQRTRIVYPVSLPLNSVRQGLAPIAFLLALFFATPKRVRRPWQSVSLALALVSAFVALRVVVTASYGFSQLVAGEQRLLDLPASIRWLLQKLDKVISGDLSMTFVVPIAVWLLFMVRPRVAQAWSEKGRAALAETVEIELPRNSRCDCGSGQKYKHCCGKNRLVEQPRATS